ncbi:hypothetical protein NX786_14095 [Telluria mixta]|uniref:Uncharacterized protein n=1 Tax=Telluria mixta TaxID=34071 RepID=A0ABT2BZT5_9BURK|nr:hypothetical protein [Telluria mixta]MCS0630467.1 hypothetical protein [Telluria mixta]WEM94230.1 hypothetical protein P0M04_22405 [Telluria mixta]
MNVVSLLVTLALASIAVAAAAQPTDIATFLKERGAEDAGLKLIARSPNPAIVPVSLFEKDNSVPSCGVLIAPPHGGKPRYIEIVGSEPHVDFPACVGMPSMTAFRLKGRDYVMIEYHSRETRDDTYHGFQYLVEDNDAGFVTDEKIDRRMSGEDAVLRRAEVGSAHPLDGIRQARASAMKTSFPQWRFLERDFIADSTSSFATFEDSKSHACLFAAEAGARPVSARLTEITGDARCAGVLASSRLTTPAATYYLALVKADAGRQRVGIVSVARDGNIRIEKELADALNRAEATRDIKTAKAALAARLNRQ